MRMASDGPSNANRARRAADSKPAAELIFASLPVALKLSASEKRELSAFANNLAAKVAGVQGFNCLITDDNELLRLNSAFLKKSFPTDVLSFPSQGNDPGEIAISIQRAAAQAVEFGHARLDEIRILMLHGVLHLAGLDHEKDKGEMARAERRWRAEFALPQTLIERARPAAKPASRSKAMAI
jgi:probable rRNA maturation factor